MLGIEIEPATLKLDSQHSNFKISGQRLLSEIGSSLNRLHNVSSQNRAHCRAIRNWLSKYNPASNVSNINKVLGYLEAFYHLCELELWVEAGKVLLVDLNTKTKEELHNQLDTWGYYQEQINLLNRLLGKLESDFDSIIITTLGNSYFSLGKYDLSIEFHQKRLILSQAEQDLEGCGTALGNLGIVYYTLGNYAKAIEYQTKSLEIARSLNNRQSEGAAIGNLGVILDSLGDYERGV
ncbi:tetratricopeptide repeat protein [Microcoleus sp. herbarium19]|uniref:tetratricopeptide repeat protein n=1 Tax=unclassified Microcoleus TaxID=2642155 RepID=UPI002FD04EFB